VRVLAIRGKNIASLAGDFEVDFQREPLASAGLFAICGPTGSGKSTLLDALCLALYDNTPRLKRATGRAVNLPDVRDETVSPQDPRNLLRRGASEGYAEVDFLGNDNVEYRSRWSVRRARGRADGRLQASDMSLARLVDGHPAAGSLKGEVLSEIERRLGLGFDQFSRAVLLAQNEFTAFLHADDNARAELLELLTGTDTFTALSIRAFNRCKAEQQALDDLGRRAGDQRPLDDGARTVVEHEATHARKTAERLGGERDRLDGQLRWHADREAALALEGQAQNDVEHAARAIEDIEPRRTHLTRVQTAQPARSMLADVDRTARDVSESLHAAVPQAEQASINTHARLQDEEARLESAREALVRAEEEQRLAAPHIERARELDLTVESLAGAGGRGRSGPGRSARAG
jgi:exonuclease SbcC